MDTLKFKMGWLVVAFDLPVVEKEERKAYQEFRNFLLTDGYIMMQFSVYVRALVTYSRMQTHIRRLEQNLPPEGSIRALYVTQSQWEKSYVIHGKPAKKAVPEEIPKQLQFW